MGLAIETVGAVLSNAATATAQAMTPAINQSFQVRATNGTTNAWLETAWADFQDAGNFRVRSPRLHDDVNAIQLAPIISTPDPLAAENFEQELYSQDTLILEAVFTVAPTAAHISTAFMQVYYDDLPGVAGNFLMWAEIQPRIQSYLSIPVTPTSAAAATGWGAGVALNSSVDVFKANSLYALIGYLTATEFAAFSLLGSDLGNLQYGGPGSTKPTETRNFFVQQEMSSGKPSIPVINSQNKAATLVQVLSKTVATAYPITLLFAYLGQAS
jgi:hypothetical protein